MIKKRAQKVHHNEHLIPPTMAVYHAPALVFIADCVSRLLVLGDDTKKELRAIADAVGVEVPMIGFFSFGEVGSEAAQPAFHNKTCALYVMPE